MAQDQSRTVIIGRFTKQPADLIKYAGSSGKKVMKIGVAVNGYKKGENQEVSFYDVEIWGKTAEFIAEYGNKGDRVCVDGRMEQQNYVNNDGEKRTSWRLIAQTVQLLQGKKTESHEEKKEEKKGVAKGAGFENKPDFDDNFYDNSGLENAPAEDLL